MRRTLVRTMFLSGLFISLFLGMFPNSAHAQIGSGPKKGLSTIQINGSTWIHDESVSTHPLVKIQSASGIHPGYTSVWRNTLNWAGWYEGDGRMSFNYTYGYWTIPCATGPYDSQHQVLDWVGLGGIAGNQNLLQAGTWLRPDGHWYIFFELYGSSNSQWNSPNFDSVPFNCGDKMYAEVDYNYYSTGANKNHVYILDLTDKTKKSFDFTVPDSFAPDLKSADWIDERPECKDIFNNQHFTNLANFHSNTWYGNGANRIGYGLVNMGTFQNTNVEMLAAGEILASEDPHPSGTSFTNRWYHSGKDGYPCG